MRSYSYLRRMTLLLMACGLSNALPAQNQGHGKDNHSKMLACAAVLFSSAEEHGGRFDAAFSASKTADLTISVLFPEDYSGKHALDLKLYTPNGYFYQSLTVPIVLAEDDDHEERLKDYPNPVKTNVLRKIKYQDQEYWKADIAFPVGGTAVTTNSLYGVWTVQLFVDGSTTSCAGPTPVTIKQ